jgi:predicted acylesterase/phospholipase RssA
MAEEWLLGEEDERSRTPRVLALLHGPSAALPSGTAAWLRPRRVAWHQHLRLDRPEDLERLARSLAGRALGLVLGGGGARAFGHLGVLRALSEARVPVDVVGGTSMGGLLASLVAMDLSHDECRAALRRAFVDTHPTRDVTLPLFAMLRGSHARRMAERTYGSRQIEDTWLRMFTVSTNLTRGEQVVHKHGSLSQAVLATIALPGVLPPVLAGGELLVDGGVLNNLPTDVMRQLDSGFTMAVEVGALSHAGASGDTLPSAWQVLAGHLRRSQTQARAPLVGEILLRSATLSSHHTLERNAREADFYLQLPVSQYRLLQFPALDEIAATSYAYASERIGAWCRESRLGADGVCERAAAPG